MKYSIVPFETSLDRQSQSLLVHTMNGIFLVEDRIMIDFIDKIKDFNFIDNNILQDFFNDDYEDALQYVGHELGIIHSIKSDSAAFDEVIFSVYSQRDRKIFEYFFGQKHLITDHFKPQQKSIQVVVNSNGIKRKFISDIIKEADDDQLIIFMLQMMDYLVITPAYSRQSILPCPVCSYDFLSGEIYNDSTEKINSLSEIYNYIDEATSFPSLPFNKLDLSYSIKYLSQYLGLFTGDGRSLQSRLVPEKAILINPNTLSHHSVDIPFSGMCNCSSEYFFRKKNAGFKNISD
ncbi:hypothetical protein [Acinetobacter sp. WZC-1]|uniref:hypothetical protein n=1 Tax=Acinetobacter sp. WZC-1 TaxID=3459034 RepID=UPI00403DE1E1